MYAQKKKKTRELPFYANSTTLNEVVEAIKHNKTNLYTHFDVWGVAWKVKFRLEVKMKVS